MSPNNNSSSSPILRTAILIVSDTAANDPSTDKSGPVLNEVFSNQGDRWGAPIVKIVKDEILDIQSCIKDWTDTDAKEWVNLIVTTGGTGFAKRDHTPEAVSPLLHRHAPGLVHAMLATSFQVTPFAMMSRPVAGVRNKTIIITLPGSPKGAKENLEAVLKLLPHACLQAAGEDSRVAHAGGVKKLEKDAGVSAVASGSTTAVALGAGHHHHHHHDHGHGQGGHKIPKAHTKPSDRPQSNDPRLGATSRARSSPYPMLSVDEAVARIIEQSPEPIVEALPMNPDLAGAIIASDIKAAEAVPAYRASIVDGYAVIISDNKEGKGIKGTFPIASVSHAQASSMPPPLKQGEIARITTGAPLPENANAVVMVEDTIIATTTDDKTEEATVEILTDEVSIGENIREPGSDIQLGATILQKGTRITSIGGEIGVLAASGTQTVPVYKRPRLGVMSTGDEVTDISHAGVLKGGMIRDSNRPSLLSLIRGWNLCDPDGGVVDLSVARDTPHDELETKLRDGFRLHDLDVIVTTGGVSMGELDLLKPTVERNLGGTVHFGRVSMKPGKPTTFATVPVKDDAKGRNNEKLIFGLPGNPASAIVTANLFLLPCLQRMSGFEDPKGLEKVLVQVVGGKIRCDKSRVEYHRVVVSCERDRDRDRGGGSGGDVGTGSWNGKLVARSTGMQRSSRVGSLASANALLVLPQREGFVEENGVCEALLMGPLLGY